MDLAGARHGAWMRTHVLRLFFRAHTDGLLRFGPTARRCMVDAVRCLDGLRDSTDTQSRQPQHLEAEAVGPAVSTAAPPGGADGRGLG